MKRNKLDIHFFYFIVIPVCMNLIAVVSTIIAFCPLPDNSRIRPMAWSSMVVVIAIGSVVIGALISVFATRSDTRLRLLILLISLCPLPFALLTFQFIVNMKGLSISG
jgi:hypothetical protein